MGALTRTSLRMMSLIIYIYIYIIIYILYIYIYIYQSINQSINQSMALSASCAGHTRTQSHAALYKINNEVVHSGMVASDYKRGSE